MKPALWIGAPVALIVALLAIANRARVPVNFYPLPWTAELPLYQVFFVGILIGLVVGMVGAWWAGRRWRREARERRREIKALKAEKAAGRSPDDHFRS
jgi:uncharacterized integral membrane protein